MTKQELKEKLKVWYTLEMANTFIGQILIIIKTKVWIKY